MTGRPNYYKLLELSVYPPELDMGKIKTAIDTKKRQWNARTNMPGKKGLEAKYFSSLTGDMLAKLGDEDFWEEEAEAAREQEKKEKQELERKQNEQVDAMIEIASSKGFITKAQIAFIQSTAGVTEAAVQKRITVEVKEGSKNTNQSSSQNTEKTNPSTIKEISSLLNTLKIEPSEGTIATLYDFLEIPERGSAVSVLFKEANEQFALYQRKTKGSQDTESRRQLYSIAKQIFQNETERRKYDRSLSEQRLSEAKILLDVACQNKTVDYFTYEALMKRLMEEGVPQKLAKEHIQMHCVQNGVELRSVKGQGEQAISLLQCGMCGIINDERSRHCKSCGDALKAPCRKCGTVNLNNANHCTGCSFALRGQFTHQKLLEEGFFHLSCSRADEAKAYFERAKKIWDNNETAAGLQQVASYKKKIADQVKRVETAIKSKHYFSAEREWIHLKNLDSTLPEHAHFERNIITHIKTAEALIQKARLSPNQREAEKLCSEALKVCADAKEAEEKLSTIAPEPPAAGTVQPAGKAFTIRWIPSSSEGKIRYEVRRSEIGVNGDKLIHETSECSFRDSTVEAGKSYTYSILSKRGNAQSSSHKASGQGFFIADVDNLQAGSDSASITLTWKAPPRSKIEVWKKENQPPSGRGDGVRMSGVKGNELIDTDVEKGKRYGYLVMIQYQDQTGKIIFSPGKPITAAAIVTEPIMDLVLEISGDAVNYRCSKPEDGDVYFLVSEEPFDNLQAGEISLFQELTSCYGGRLLRVPGSCEGRLDVPSSGRCSVLPVTKAGETAILGNARSVRKMFEVSEIDAALNDQGKILLTWKWPEGTDQAVVAFSQEAFPKEPKDPAAVHREVSLNAYNAFGGYLIDQTGISSLYIKVFIMEELNGEIVFSEGESYYYTNSKPVSLSYKVEMKFFKKKKNIRITSDHTAVPLPKLAVIRQNGRQPITITDGTEIMTIPEGTLPGDAVFDISAYSEPDSYIRVFLANPKDYKRFMLESFGSTAIY